MRSLARVMITGMLLATCARSALDVVTNRMTSSNPYTNPLVPYCFLGNKPVCSKETDAAGNLTPKTYINRCVLILLAKPFGYDGWCKFDATPPNSSTGVEQYPKNAANGFAGDWTDTTEGRCKCLQIFNPVCAENGATYMSHCAALCNGVKVISRGPCGTFDFKPPIRPKACKCDIRAFEPYCGNDGATYNSQCVLACGGATVVSVGACTSPCGCSNASSPVCSDSGQEFRNECLMKCAGGTMKYNYACPVPAPAECQYCVGFTKPVCGVNGITYDNECLLNCARVKKYADYACPSNKPCNCDKKVYVPVCGIDHRTYNSQCLLDCTSVRKAYNGVCKNGLDCSYCPKDLNPVCGRDGKTYQNECFIQCHGTQPLFYGECQPLNGPNCFCPNDDGKSSVCGNDGKTYKSVCIAKCLGIDGKYQGRCGLVGSGCELNGCGAPPVAAAVVVPAEIIKIYQAYLIYFPGGRPASQQAVAYYPYFKQALSPYGPQLGVSF